MPQKEDIFVSKKSSSAAEIEKNHAGGCLKKKAFLSLKKFLRGWDCKKGDGCGIFSVFERKKDTVNR